MASRQALREVIAAGGSRRFASVVALSLLAAVTEGAGFVLLVPLLAALGGAEMPLGLALPRWPIEGLLGVFVILVAVRAGVEVLRRLAVQDLRIAVVDGKETSDTGRNDELDRNAGESAKASATETSRPNATGNAGAQAAERVGLSGSRLPMPPGMRPIST